MPYHDDDDYSSSATSRPYARRVHATATNNGLTANNNASNEERAIEAKLVVMGNTGVGKTSLVTRYTEDRFSARTTATTGALFVSHKTDFNGLPVRLQIWDTAGQERFRSLAPIYYRGANAAIIMYDLTRLESFNDVRIWIEELRKNCDPDLLIYIVGSKADLTASRQITPDRVRATLRKWFPPAPVPTTSLMPGMPRATTTPNLTGLNLNAYLRPRFTSLTSAYTVNSGSSSGSGPTMRGSGSGAGAGAGLSRAKTSATATPPSKRARFNEGPPSRSQSLSVQTPAIAIKDAAGPSGVARREGIRFNSFQSFDALPTVGGGKGHIAVVNGANKGHHRERSWGPSGLNLNLGLTGSSSASGPKSAGAALAFPRFLGRGSEEAVSDEDENSDEIAAALEEEEAEWGLGRHMRLFEVSAKDASGIESLFEAILGAVCERREIIEAERRARERDSVLLHANYGPVYEEDEAKEKENPRSWACC